MRNGIDGLLSFVHDLGFDDLPAEVVAQAKRCTRDLVATAAGGMIIDSFDAHDGHLLTKGHAGVAVLPAALAYADGAWVELSARS